ncbi:flagellar biosynthetic protein FliP [Thermoclostridium stercorarium subsp. stercorarium DSM 8532]|uniref:Flagellar biosynthetic protein FliP n=3 Tax=Thermoclostridium stercorarium TaxID=1510 RepID=M4YKW8_THES1|nr:flagellar type III secretion system pore protein FliP [Thermoclostridium stercorarium]AGC67600.1 flagellar biosynthetic protein FliP [Thermoclostridium stercorarium subsp. stercorarium DSM 8532]AGI38650.1 FliP [Thermoclostridium stercorarium subsp. stercorarium DSM 8532]ANW98022.1 flagellar biosynthetic protein FliP [Thermoclostridium stercorarium subsp. thermolacticum DSM 2910]ANX00570.1 flagellar biosynthetic protein FliP [Thermoclostridium stercorarium subsp. leptospartum DSM 9219]
MCVKGKKLFFSVLVILLLTTVFNINSNAQPGITISNDGITITASDNPEDVTDSIKLLLFLTVLSVLPSIIIMMTSFTRIIVVLSFLRNAMGTQQMPPNQVLIGLALFLTFFIMSPVLSDLNEQALKPLSENEITLEEAIDKASYIMKDFMLNKAKVREKDLALFANIARIEEPENLMDLPMKVVIPAFMISELTTAFKMGFMLYIPFLVIDMVVASTLMSMGMMMLPPVMISLPFKILLFLLVDGWNLVIGTIVQSFG